VRRCECTKFLRKWRGDQIRFLHAKKALYTRAKEGRRCTCGVRRGSCGLWVWHADITTTYMNYGARSCSRKHCDRKEERNVHGGEITNKSRTFNSCCATQTSIYQQFVHPAEMKRKGTVNFFLPYTKSVNLSPTYILL
jgi:hypothetical protein